ncbi:hypothetical protein B0H13DRAFT_2373978 [Mycena leptocephala]|nr:hypothetical protein B0H13DRAFT_2373978 [Mycena leptocephala]
MFLRTKSNALQFNETSVPSYKRRPGFVPMCKATARKRSIRLMAHLVALASSVAEKPWRLDRNFPAGLDYGRPSRIHTPPTLAAVPIPTSPLLILLWPVPAYASAAAGEHRLCPPVALRPRVLAAIPWAAAPYCCDVHTPPAPVIGSLPPLTTSNIFAPAPPVARTFVVLFDLRPSAAHYTQAVASPTRFTPAPYHRSSAWRHEY